VNLAALVNDTVGTLVARHYADPACQIGVILGTGTNACYVEKADRVAKWESDEGVVVINTEWGGFGSLPKGTDMLPVRTYLPGCSLFSPPLPIVGVKLVCTRGTLGLTQHGVCADHPV